MLKKDKILLEKYNGINPTCACGCGQLTKYEANLKDYHLYVRGHHTRVKGYWGDLKDPDKAIKISESRKKKFESGEYDHVKEAINNRDNISLGKTISKRMKGVAKPKPEGFGIGRIHSQGTKDKMSQTAIDNILKEGKTRTSKLEDDFGIMMKVLEIEYIQSYYIESIRKIYDFYLPKYNILIEIDGDFWHCNPIKFSKPVCKTQEINIENDKFKNKWAQDNNYRLLRFWENDINNNILEVKRILLENCK